MPHNARMIPQPTPQTSLYAQRRARVAALLGPREAALIDLLSELEINA